MEEELKFEEAQERIENPNPKNNIFIPYCEGTAANINCLICVMFGVCAIAFGIYEALTNLDNLGYVIIKLLVLVAGGIVLVREGVQLVFPKYVLIPIARTKGHAYPGVVIGEQAKVAAIFGAYDPDDPDRHGLNWASMNGRRTYYSIDIRYWKKKVHKNGEVREQTETVHILGYHVKPSMCLENPYCTVYEYGNKKFALDFKVRDRFVDQKGRLIDEEGKLNDDVRKFYEK